MSVVGVPCGDPELAGHVGDRGASVFRGLLAVQLGGLGGEAPRLGCGAGRPPCEDIEDARHERRRGGLIDRRSAGVRLSGGEPTELAGGLQPVEQISRKLALPRQQLLAHLRGRGALGEVGGEKPDLHVGEGAPPRDFGLERKRSQRRRGPQPLHRLFHGERELHVVSSFGAGDLRTVRRANGRCGHPCALRNRDFAVEIRRPSTARGHEGPFSLSRIEVRIAEPLDGLPGNVEELGRWEDVLVAPPEVPLGAGAGVRRRAGPQRDRNVVRASNFEDGAREMRVTLAEGRHRRLDDGSPLRFGRRPRPRAQEDPPREDARGDRRERARGRRPAPCLLARLRARVGLRRDLPERM